MTCPQENTLHIANKHAAHTSRHFEQITLKDDISIK